MSKEIYPWIQSDFTALPKLMRSNGADGRRVMIVADTNTGPLYSAEVKRALEEVSPEVHCFTLPAGEEHKNIGTLEDLFRELIRLHFDRNDVIAALGGGVTGDMAGFAAAVYLRGIRVIQIPTTLLAQIDSSIGGKTAVDFDGYKNMIGAFHMPLFVYCNPTVLSTLMADQFSSGMGEVVKSALLADADFFHFLERNAHKINERDTAALDEMIRRCSAIKAAIVERDPKEKGERALLNLGHTIGHAIEKAKGFELLHGSCVALGLLAAARISMWRGLLNEEDLERITALLEAFGLPLTVSGVAAEEVLSLTKSDKKMAAGQIRFVLLASIGEAFVSTDVTDAEMTSGIQSLLE